MAREIIMGTTVPEEKRVATSERVATSDREAADRAQIFLQPIASPSILGLFGFAGAALMVGAYGAHWYGSPVSPLYLLPFVAFFGGLAQFLAAMWSYKARDGLATGMHGMWGSFWMAYGLLNIMGALGYIKLSSTVTLSEYGFWYVVLAWITWVGAFAAMRQSWGMAAWLGLSAIAATCGAVGEFMGLASLMTATGWVFVASAIAAWYVASGMLLESTFGREVLPYGRFIRKDRMQLANAGFNEPGVIRGQ